MADASRHEVQIRAAMVSSLIVLALASQALALPPAAVDVPEVVAAWRQRQTRVQSLEFTWQQPTVSRSRWKNYQSTWLPSEKSVIQCPPNVLTITGDRTLYQTERWYYPASMEYSGFNTSARPHLYYGPDEPYFRLYFHEKPHVSFLRGLEYGFHGSAKQRRNPRHFRSYRDSAQRIDIFEKGDGDYGQATIFDWPSTAESLAEIIDDLYFRPVILTFRPLYPSFGSIRPETCRIIAQQSYVNGVTCVILEESKPSGVVGKYWLDAAREFVIVRYIAEQQSQPRAQLDISYAKDAEQGWIPSAWTTMLLPQTPQFVGHERLLHDAAARVMTHTFNEPAISVTTHSIEIPEGTFVVNHARNEAHIQLPGGRKRIVTRADVSDPEVTYAKLTSWTSHLSQSRLGRTLTSYWWQGLLLLFVGGVAASWKMGHLRGGRARRGINSGLSGVKFGFRVSDEHTK